MRFVLVTLSACLLLIGGQAAEARSRSQVVVYPVQDSFENVKQDAGDAIIKRGLVIDYTGQIGAMLDRTAKDVGASKRIYGDAAALQFCSAALSRRVMEADPEDIAFCPYVIVVYTLASDPKTAYVGYRLLPRGGSRQTRTAVRSVNRLLDEIAREAAKRK